MRTRLTALTVIAFCSANCSLGRQDFVPSYTIGPATVVYKTKADYSNNVPIALSEDKMSVVSFPDPKDLEHNGKYATPTKLKNGYLLDNRGIGKNVAFLKMTYAEYAALTAPPSPKELMTMIADKDPLTELCNCGNKNAIPNPEKQMNQLIKKKQLRKVCRVVK